MSKFLIITKLTVLASIIIGQDYYCWPRLLNIYLNCGQFRLIPAYSGKNVIFREIPAYSVKFRHIPWFSGFSQRPTYKAEFCHGRYVTYGCYNSTLIWNITLDNVSKLIQMTRTMLNELTRTTYFTVWSFYIVQLFHTAIKLKNINWQ
jgi:hypothetical protein